MQNFSGVRTVSVSFGGSSRLQVQLGPNQVSPLDVALEYLDIESSGRTGASVAGESRDGKTYPRTRPQMSEGECGRESVHGTI